MDEHSMVHKANSIAQFFAAYPHDEAVAGVEDHLRRFWPPLMRKQLIEYVSAGGSGLHALVPEAVSRLVAPTRP